MAKVQFFTQEMIDLWVDQGKCDFDGEQLAVLIEPKRVFRLQPATRFLKIIDGQDKLGIVGKILNDKHIAEYQVEILSDTAIIGEVAYKVQPGFVVDTSRPQDATATTAGSSQPNPPPATAVSHSGSKPKSDEDLLADFMLNKLEE